jgi:hypothetical protein
VRYKTKIFSFTLKNAIAYYNGGVAAVKLKVVCRIGSNVFLASNSYRSISEQMDEKCFNGARIRFGLAIAEKVGSYQLKFL